MNSRGSFTMQQSSKIWWRSCLLLSQVQCGRSNYGTRPHLSPPEPIVLHQNNITINYRTKHSSLNTKNTNLHAGVPHNRPHCSAVTAILNSQTWLLVILMIWPRLYWLMVPADVTNTSPIRSPKWILTEERPCVFVVVPFGRRFTCRVWGTVIVNIFRTQCLSWICCRWLLYTDYLAGERYTYCKCFLPTALQQNTYHFHFQMDYVSNGKIEQILHTELLDAHHKDLH